MSPNPKLAVMQKALCAVKARRPIFHSEADLQCELIREMEKTNLASVRPELRLPIGEDKRGKLQYGKIDIVAKGVAVELKYNTTAKFQFNLNEEQFDLRGTPQSRSQPYKFWYDVWRLEQLVKRNHVSVGYAICVSNNSGLWEGRAGNTNPDWLADFRMQDGRVFPLELKLRKGKKPAHWDKRMQIIPLSKKYTLQWREWSNLGVRHGRFRYVILEITR